MIGYQANLSLTQLLFDFGYTRNPLQPNLALEEAARLRLATAQTDLVIGGLMAMPPSHSDAEMSRPHFAAVRRLADDLAREWDGRHDFRDLSMGTSQDYLVAAEEGATKVRVGRGLLERVQTTTQGNR